MLLLKVLFSLFFAAYVAVACGGVYVCIGNGGAHIASVAHTRRIDEQHRRICRAARSGSLERGDGVSLHNKYSTEREIKSVYHKLSKELHPDKISRRVPVETATKQFACINIGYTKLMHGFKYKRCIHQCMAERLEDAENDANSWKYIHCRVACKRS